MSDICSRCGNWRYRPGSHCPCVAYSCNDDEGNDGVMVIWAHSPEDAAEKFAESCDAMEGEFTETRDVTVSREETTKRYFVSAEWDVTYSTEDITKDGIQ